MHETRPTSNRLQRYYIGSDCALNYLRALKDWPACFGRAIVRDIPDDAKIVNLYYSMDRRSFVVHVEHDSFPEVPAGAEVPEGAGGYLNIEYVFLSRQADGSYRHGPTPNEAIRGPIPVPGNLDVRELSTDQLITLREQVNTLLYDRSK